MIGAEIPGRLGNQMFAYAYARKLIEARGHRDELCLGFRIMNGEDASLGFTDELHNFNVLPYTATRKRITSVMGSPMQKLVSWLFLIDRKIEMELLDRQVHRIERKWWPLFDRVALHYSFANEYMYRLPQQKTVLTAGFFQNQRYFADIRDILLKEFSPRFPELEHNKELYETIRSTDSVCVQVRRGDYISVAANERIFNICDKQYFERAFQEIRKRVERPVFIFFSDDIQWVRENINTPEPCYYERGDDPVWETLRLMYNCKHFVISNSSFGWWAQWLSRNYKDKVVVSPSRWYKVEGPEFLIQEDFVKV